MPDPERSTELLWGTTAKRALNLEVIVRTAIGLADTEGLQAVSMRRVAEKLGFTTMSLYRHVPGKAELVELMRDAAMADQTQPGDWPDWRAELAAWARAGLARYRRHPWLIESAGPRTVPGPNAVAIFEQALAGARRAGLPPAQIVGVVTLLGGFVESAARQVVQTTEAEQRSGVTHDEWWGARDSLYQHLDQYPTLSWIYQQGGYDKPLDPFEFGLERVLDSIAALIRDEKRDESSCRVCGKPVEVTGKGRPRDYCSRACQQRAYRMKRS
ncbi:AcrR family transcriptional regulator [Kibdelosporangium banguiense]|uniref:AcrR family transcriptional regulator n=1 Tax=Kibdelosporangium banguiense TaxID=1365924 RepID=A0ABS4TUM8_9PSEU|nr:TetR/AcrR family transcriptional regulator [Kibdelosporangium banguiense]MBP2327626.1 AcrR family transcriptional regulator [Kibdelosporangium banguiense]